MASKMSIGTPYKGLDRRSNGNRRDHPDRRNLVRFESLGSDRRQGDCRRDEELAIKLYP